MLNKSPLAHGVFVYLPSLRMGGGESSMVRLAAGFANRGLVVTLVVHDDVDRALAVPPGVALVSLGVGRSLLAVARLASLLRRERPSVLLSAFPHSNIVAVAARALAGVDCRVVLSEHAPVRRQRERIGGWRYRLLPLAMRCAYPFADAIVAVSEGVRDDLAAIDRRLAARVIHNPVLASDWATRAVEGGGHPWLDDASLDVVLSVSRLSPEKDLPTLVAAFAAMAAQRPRARLLIGGTGPEQAAIEACVSRFGLGDRVCLAGLVTNPLSWMRRARVFVLASQFEGFGNVLVEALAVGTRVVATDCPVGPREILQDGRLGCLVPVGDVLGMSRAIIDTLDAQSRPQPGLQAQRAEARAMARRFTQERASDAYLSLFESLRPTRAVPRAA